MAAVLRVINFHEEIILKGNAYLAFLIVIFPRKISELKNS